MIKYFCDDCGVELIVPLREMQQSGDILRSYDPKKDGDSELCLMCRNQRLINEIQNIYEKKNKNE